MNIFFQDPNEIRLPPEEVRLLNLQVTPLPNSQRIKVFVELTPFMKRPSLDVTIKAASGKVGAHSSILEAMLPRMEFTMHMRDPEPGSKYTVESVVYYQKLPEPSDEPIDVPLPEPMIVDRCEVTFILPLQES